jgi:hypothetical protein
MAPNLSSEDYYQILGVPKSADDAALKKAYKKLAVKVSHNKNFGDDGFMMLTGDNIMLSPVDSQSRS